MERQALLATLLSALILLGYWYFFLGQSTPPSSPEGPIPETASPPPPSAAPVLLPTPGVSPSAAREVVAETPLVRLTLSTHGGALRRWELKSYEYLKGVPVNLVAQGKVLPLTAWSGERDMAGESFQPEKTRISISSAGETEALSFVATLPSGLRLTKTLTFKGNSYGVGLTLRWSNVGGKELKVSPHLIWGPGVRGEEKGESNPVQVTTWLDRKRIVEDVTKLDRPVVYSGEVSWIALHDTYFAAVLLPRSKGMMAMVGREPGSGPVIGVQMPSRVLRPGEEIIQEVVVYGGPKELQSLNRLGSDLEELVDLGWSGFLARPIIAFLNLLYRFTKNYGLAIILLTLVFKALFHPLTRKSLRAMRVMQELQPKVAALQEKYKNNPQKKNQETMELFKRHGANPMQGCLPMLIQLPIFFALYTALSSAVELWRAPFILWIDDLSAPDTLFVLPFTVPFLGEGVAFRVLPLLMGASQYFQQKLAPTGGDPRQAQMMLYVMPVFLTFIFWSLPSGLVLYWFVSNLLQIGEQHLLFRKGRPTLVS